MVFYFMHIFFEQKGYSTPIRPGLTNVEIRYGNSKEDKCLSLATMQLSPVIFQPILEGSRISGQYFGLNNHKVTIMMLSVVQLLRPVAM